jgi:hypothetical protein
MARVCVIFSSLECHTHPHVLGAHLNEVNKISFTGLKKISFSFFLGFLRKKILF